MFLKKAFIKIKFHRSKAYTCTKELNFDGTAGKETIKIPMFKYKPLIGDNTSGQSTTSSNNSTNSGSSVTGSSGKTYTF